jgi:hypothetical protein
LVLVIEPDASTYIVNESAAEILLNAYHLHSDMAVFDPATWSSLEDQVAADPAGMIGQFGPKVSAFVEAAPTERSLADLALLSYAVVAPGQRVSIGKPLTSPRLCLSRRVGCCWLLESQDSWACDSVNV